MMHEEICTYEVSQLAKEKGFDLDCPLLYNLKGKLMYGRAYGPMNSGLDMRDLLCHNSKLPLGFGAECAAPTQSLLQRWLREEKGLHITVPFDNNEFWWQIKNLANGDSEYGEALGFDTYELALEDAIAYSLKNLV